MCLKPVRSSQTELSTSLRMADYTFLYLHPLTSSHKPLKSLLLMTFQDCHDRVSAFQLSDLLFASVTLLTTKSSILFLSPSSQSLMLAYPRIVSHLLPRFLLKALTLHLASPATLPSSSAAVTNENYSLPDSRCLSATPAASGALYTDCPVGSSGSSPNAPASCPACC